MAASVRGVELSGLLENKPISGRSSERLLRHVLASCLLVYIFSAKGYVEISDTFVSLQTAQAIVTHGRLDIPYAEGATLKGLNGKSYSKYGVGLPLYYVPWVAAGNALSSFAGLPVQEVTGFVISFAHIPFAMLTLVLFAKLLRLFGVTGVYMWLLPLGLGLGTLAWRYAGYDFSEEMQMGFLMLAVYGVARATPKAIIGAGAGLAGLFLVKLVYIAFFPLFLIYLMTSRENHRVRIRNAALFTFPCFLAGGFVALLNFVRFGSLFESGYGTRRFTPSKSIC